MNWYERGEVRWLMALAAAVLAYLVLQFVLDQLKKRVERSASGHIKELIGRLVNATSIVFIIGLAVYTGLRFVVLNTAWRSFTSTAILVLALVQIGLWGVALIDYAVWRRIAIQQEVSGSQKTTYSALSLVSKIGLWALIAVLILDNLPGINATSLVASLGIGGIAIGLAVQSILGDLFSSLTISLDKPFIIGDFIKVGELSGTVEHIGLKSTRVRAISGEQLIFSNSDLLSSRVQNFRRMEKRRVSYQLGVEYKTTQAQLEMIPGLMKEIIEAQPHVQFDRAHFIGFGPYSLDFEIVYFLDSSDYTLYMDVQQAIHLATYGRFAEANIQFAYPSQTIYIESAGGSSKDAAHSRNDA